MKFFICSLFWHGPYRGLADAADATGGAYFAGIIMPMNEADKRKCISHAQPEGRNAVDQAICITAWGTSSCRGQEMYQKTLDHGIIVLGPHDDLLVPRKSAMISIIISKKVKRSNSIILAYFSSK